MGSTETCDFLIAGAGVIGVAIARELRRRHGAKVVVLEKEPVAGFHASGRNSGVLHAGVYYKAGTLKAKLCVEGNRRLRAYCHEKAIPLNDYGKVIVARREAELPALRELYTRSEANGVRVSLLDQAALREVEPCAKTVQQALYVKDTAVVNPQRVMAAMVADAEREGVQFRLGTAWLGREGEAAVRTTQGDFAYGHFVNCGGLFADRIAHAYGVGLHYKILPFRGQFYRLRPESKLQVRGNIYPVPDLRNPFLGVHFTRRPEGEVTIGPSALPLLGREQYRGLSGATLGDGLTMLTYLIRLFGRNRDHFRSIAWTEMVKLTRTGFFREAEDLGIGFEKSDLLPGKEPGIRAQLIDTRTADLLSDFVIEPGSRSTHVLNAVSPAFTSSLPFAEHVVGMMKVE
ncbi:L-2-hydroxyglutarate oxidase [Nitrospirales bacterium NOB]|nr:MAG: putative l-2-hydroxyglutarate oxidase [Nitrospira sp. OLB3]MBV6470251.1 L-2-hydroxyglutarate oxidase LhgO [Nitrospirota bacterium]MCE7964283.1 L-2-hydroxyglutarate oxidase [Nitrospira sp. NTP2]MCK6492640.1 L-2-hydroxyglutarate oxidase [Nitrospira sp.]MDL1889956.1 L-2-hydroxyglutarate oxidase [Nitrospirales bacterium NOB]MEB2337289.1 L-2-hydroxyglutarate oxidase [Nitrospirales bacterium]